MASQLIADTGAVSGISGLRYASDSSGVLQILTGAGGVAVTLDALQNVSFANAISVPNTFGFKNRIINGAMMIDQRNLGASKTISNSTDTYYLDRWAAYTGTNSNNTIQQVSTAPARYVNSIQVTIGTGASPAVGTPNYLYQVIEGLNCSDLAWGSASASPVSVSFWVRSSLTGTFSGSLSNSGVNRSYPFTYTINAANTWEQKTITIAGDQSGTWLTTNGVGIRVWFDLGSGSNFQGSAGAWAAADKRAASGSTQLVATTGATFYITGVQLEKSTQATSFDFREYGEEQRKCYRYYFKTGGSNSAMLASGQCFATTGALVGLITPQIMRATPTLAYVNLALWSAASNGLPITGLTIGGYSGNILRLDAVVASGLTAGNATFLNAGSSSGTLELNAEL